jgi:hypothetical protein
VLAQIDEVGVIHDSRGSGGDEHLPAMRRGHDTRSPIQRWSEIIVVAK